jgi:hypothetical protein
MDYSYDDHCTVAEAHAVLRKHKRGRKAVIMASVSLWTDKERTKAFPGGACVRLSFKDAERFITDCLAGSFEDRGGRIRIAVTDTLIFIG